MTPIEAIQLCRFAKACCPQQAFDEYTPDAWGELLSEVLLPDALEAVKRICRRQPFVAPAEIIAEAKTVWFERIRELEKSAGLLSPYPENDSRHYDWSRCVGSLTYHHSERTAQEIADEATRQVEAQQLAELEAGAQ